MKIRVRYRDNRRELKRGTVRWFGISMTLLSMAAVALLSALLTVRIAIHAGEVEVPEVSGLTLDEASDKTHDAALNLTVENRFYSTTVPAGRVLSQSPAPGTSVRKGWHMRITESMGPQRATIPDTIGMDQRDAAAAIRRSSMDLGTVAHLPAPGPADVVLGQTPPPNAEGVEKPEVSLLVSQPFANAPRAYVMPNLVGLSFSTARARMKEMNLPLWAIVPQSAPPVTSDGAIVGDAAAPPAPTVIAGPIASQVPIAGARVTATDNPHVTMTRGYSAPAPAAPATTTPPAPTTLPPATVAQPAAPIVRVPPAH
ncbi:PASTA domain-containing protein [Terriglobus sp.]|uniref:PASTA domain-containing protein n=1 Tax=Terriglobus sp. TaxID=1889013 RepID=UPI003AFFDE4C